MTNRYTRDSGVRVTSCDSWDDFIQALRITKKEPSSPRIYRGHADPDWKLSSTWERYLEKLDELVDGPRRRRFFNPERYSQNRNQWLRRFTQLTTTMPEMPLHVLDPNSPESEKWAFGRHYGLKTPLLDWSRSPFIACFWAVMERVTDDNPDLDIPRPGMRLKTTNEPIIVWELSIPDNIFIKGQFELVDNMRYELHRQRAQSGVFTHLEHEDYIDIEGYLKSRSIGSYLERYEVPLSTEIEICTALSDLQRMNINYATLFPDAHGAAMQSNLSFMLDWLIRKASKEEPSWDGESLSMD